MNDIVSTPPVITPAGSMDAGAFWGSIDTDAIRALLRIGGGTVSPDRLRAAIRFGIMDVTRQLGGFRAAHEASGVHSLAEAGGPSDTIDGHSAAEWLFLRAVAMTAGAELADRYPDLTATREGAMRADLQTDSADDYRRSATRAIRALMGRGGTLAELI